MTRLASVLEEVNSEAEKVGRKVSLMAVSKTHPYQAILDAYGEGQRLFGENRVQEVLEKFPPKGERPAEMKVCLIGHLQKNKVKKAVKSVDRIDSVDSIALLTLIDKECGKLSVKMPLLLEYNSSKDENKSGFSSEEELLEAVKLFSSLSNVYLEGIMTVGPLGGDEAKNRHAFRETFNIYNDVKKLAPSVNLLSMGMSGDFKWAIEEGSNLVRIGTAIFGARDYSG